MKDDSRLLLKFCVFFFYDLRRLKSSCNRKRMHMSPHKHKHKHKHKPRTKQMLLRMKPLFILQNKDVQCFQSLSEDP